VECQVSGRLVDRKLTLLVVKLRPDKGDLSQSGVTASDHEDICGDVVRVVGW
jgi:hypothetical protein